MANVLATVQKGALRTVAPEALALTAGFASTRAAEVFAYEQFPDLFGADTGEGLSEDHMRNRKLLKGGLMLAAGTALAWPGKKPVILKQALMGFLAGETWHLANDFGLNY